MNGDFTTTNTAVVIGARSNLVVNGNLKNEGYLEVSGDVLVAGNIKNDGELKVSSGVISSSVQPAEFFSIAPDCFRALATYVFYGGSKNSDGKVEIYENGELKDVITGGRWTDPSGAEWKYNAGRDAWSITKSKASHLKGVLYFKTNFLNPAKDLTVEGEDELRGMVVVEKDFTTNGHLTVQAEFPWSYVIVVGGNARFNRGAKVKGRIYIGGNLIVTGPVDVEGKIKVKGNFRLHNSLNLKYSELAYQAQAIIAERTIEKKVTLLESEPMLAPDGSPGGSISVFMPGEVTQYEPGGLLHIYDELSPSDITKIVAVFGGSTIDGHPAMVIEEKGSAVLNLISEARAKLMQMGYINVRLKRLYYLYPWDIYAEFDADGETKGPYYINIADGLNMSRKLTSEVIEDYYSFISYYSSLDPQLHEEGYEIRTQIWKYYEELAKEKPLPEQASAFNSSKVSVTLNRGPEECLEPLEEDLDCCKRTKYINYVGDFYDPSIEYKRASGEPDPPEPYPASEIYYNQAEHAPPEGNYCAPVASAMVLGYWARMNPWYFDCFSGYSPAKLTESTKLVKDTVEQLGEAMNTNNNFITVEVCIPGKCWTKTKKIPGTLPWDIDEGTCYVTGKQKVNFYCDGHYTFVWDNVRDNIKKHDSPGVLCGANLHTKETGDYDAHCVTAFGYRRDKFSSKIPVLCQCFTPDHHYALVHTGWREKLWCKLRRPDWVCYLLFKKPPCYDGWGYTGDINQCKPGTDVGYSEDYPHRVLVDWWACDPCTNSFSFTEVWPKDKQPVEYLDLDGDGYGTSALEETECGYWHYYHKELSWASNTRDCNDLFSSIHPGAEEICDNKDNDCNKEIDEGCDDDGDNYCDAFMTVIGKPAVCPNGGGDCVDEVYEIHPGQIEVCNNCYDENCNGEVDEAGCENYELCDNGKDDDNDGIVDEDECVPDICIGGGCRASIALGSGDTTGLWFTFFAVLLSYLFFKAGKKII